MSHQSGGQEGRAEDDTKGILDEERRRDEEEDMPSRDKKGTQTPSRRRRGQTRGDTCAGRQAGSERDREREKRGSKRFSWWKQITKRWDYLLTRIVTIGVIAPKRVRQRKVSDSGIPIPVSRALKVAPAAQNVPFAVTVPENPRRPQFLHRIPCSPSGTVILVAVRILSLSMPECRCAHHPPRGIRQQLYVNVLTRLCRACRWSM